jgi:hypothetical protein
MYEVEKKVETDKPLDGYLAKTNGDVTPYIKNTSRPLPMVPDVGSM